MRHLEASHTANRPTGFLAACLLGVAIAATAVGARAAQGQDDKEPATFRGRGEQLMKGGATGAAQFDPKAARIADLMQRYGKELGSLRVLFEKSANKDKTPAMGEATERKLAQVTESFFKELAGMGLSLRDLQQFKEDFKAAGPGGSPLFPGQGAWDDAFLGTERAIMMGRAQLVQRLWMETLRDTFRNHPDAAVFGEIDIGSWVKMRLGDLGFQADIDFSSVSIDPDLNRWIADQFQSKLSAHTGLDMIQADALLTAHGQATADVFIGDWGKTFAELDMLKRSKWKVIRVEKDANGNLILDENGQPRIRMIEKPGTQLFWEVAFRKLEAGQFAEVDFPKMDLAKEPMLSLEMLRHGIHDIEHGPYSRGQKVIKMLKYAERSFFMNKKAVAEFQFNPYEKGVDPLLAEVAGKVIANKNDPAKVADLLRALAGEEITPENVDDIVEHKLIPRAKTAMHDNAARALAFRLNAIAKIDSEEARRQAAEKLWTDLGTELDTFRDTSGEPPRVMTEAQELAKALIDGKISPAELEAKANQLHKLLDEAYRLPESVIDRILVSDTYLKLKAYLRKLGWIEKSIDDFVKKAKEKYPNGAKFHAAVMELNAQLEKTTSGSLLMKSADWADNAFTVYEAYYSGDAKDALWNASLAMGRIGAQSYFPSLQIPFAIYDSFKTGSPKPLGMAVAFMYFPFAGQMYMTGTLMQRADVAIRDAEFYAGLNKVLDVTDFDTRGRITGFRLLNLLGKEIDSAGIAPPGDRKAIVALFSGAESPFYVSPNFRYWSSLVPKRDDRFGLYETKLGNLRRFFGLSEDVRYMTTMLENFKAKSEAMPQDAYTAQRQEALTRMEDQLAEVIWIAMADMLESAARATGSPELEAKIRKIEDDLNLRDEDLGKNQGLLAKIKWEIRQNSSLFSGENPYAVGLIYDKYLKAYERVEALRKQIIHDVWHAGFGIDYVAAQSRPMKVLLIGPKSGAPLLSGDPAKDIEIAEAALAAHQARAQTIRADLEGALQRRIDPKKDAEHLRKLGQWGFEWQHLLDDCPERQAAQCAPEVRGAMKERFDAYKAYLASLAGGQAVQPEILGPAEVKENATQVFEAKLTPAEAWKRPGLILRWSLNGKPGPEAKTFDFKAGKAGEATLGLVVLIRDARGETELGKASRAIKIVPPGKGDGPGTGKGDAKTTAEAKYQWLKDSLAYLETLKEYDRKTFASFKNGVTSAMARQFVAANPRPYDDSAKLPADCSQITSDVLLQADCYGAKQAGCGQTVGDARNRMNQFGAECSSTLAKGCAVIRWSESTRTVNGEKVRVAEPVTDCDEVCAKARLCERMFSIYSGRAGYASDVQGYINDHYIRCLGDAGAANGKRQKELARKIAALPETLPFKRWQEYKAYNDWAGYLAAVDKVKQEFNLPDPIPSPPVLPWSYSSPCGAAGSAPPPTESKGALHVTLSGPTGAASLKLGEPATLNAGVAGGKPPYRYEWSGARGAGAKGTAKPAWAGDWTVLVKVTDADGKTGEAKTTLSVRPMALTLTGAKGKVYYGRTYVLNAEGLEPAAAPPPPEPKSDPCAGRPRTSNPFDECNEIKVDTSKAVSVAPVGVPPPPVPVRDVPAQTVPAPDTGSTASGLPPGGKYRYIWQAEPAVTFNAPTTDKPSTRVTYDRMGQVKLWCEAHVFAEGAWHTVAECDQVSVEVVAPAFTFTFTPANGEGRVGQEVRAALSTKPEVAAKYLDYRWFDPGSSNRMEYTQNAASIGFKVKDVKPMPLKVLARVPHYGDTIADLSATYTGVAYDVKIGAPRLNGPQLQVWVCDTQFGHAQQCGMKDIPQGQFVTFQDIYLKAMVTPAPEAPRYRWSVSPSGSCGLPGSGSELHLNCSNTGSYAIHLEVTDAEGVVLGQAESSVSVSVRMEQTQPGKKPDSGADAKVRQAKQMVEQGKLDQAIDLATQAASLDAGHPEAVALRDRWKKERQQVSEALGDMRKAMEKGSMDAAGKHLAEAQRLHPRYPPVLDAERDYNDRKNAGQARATRIAQLADTVRSRIRAGQYAGALDPIADLRPLDALKANALSKELAAAAGQAARDAERKRDFEQSGRLFGIAKQADPGDIEAERGVDNALVYMRRMQEMRAWQQDARAALDRGDFDTAKARLHDIQNRESTLPGPPDALTTELQARHDREFAAYLNAMDDLKTRAEKALRDGKCDEARGWLGKVSARRPVEQERQWLDQMRRQLAARERRGECAAGATATATPTTGVASGGRDYTSVTPDSGGTTQTGSSGMSTGFIRIEACVDGSDWLRIDNGWLAHEHRAFNQIGTHPDCPATHRVAGGGLIVDGQKVALAQLPRAVAIASLGRYEVESARGTTRLDGAKGLLLDDDRQGGAAVYSVRLYPSPATGTGAASAKSEANAKPTVSFDNSNIGGVGNGPRQPTTFILHEPRILALIQNYHWNDGRGKSPGSIGLSDAQGRRYGPWSATGSPGQGGVPNAYWSARPMVLLPAGTYGIVDSDPASWSRNDQSGYRGFSRVETLPPGAPGDGDAGRDYTSPPIRTSPVGAAPAGVTGATPPASAKVIFEVGNTGRVANQPPKGSKFELDAPHVITLIRDYHWNDGRGAPPGTIALRCRDKRTYGPWPAIGAPGPGGVPNVHWMVQPNETLPATTCAIVDSDPATWAHNEESGGRGFTRVEGYPAGQAPGATGSASGQVRDPIPRDPILEKTQEATRTMEDAQRALDLLKGLFK